MRKYELKPTLWRTERTLENEDRLRVFKAVVEHDGMLCVRDYARMLGLQDDEASVYLRQLNARGLLGVVRSDIKVFYNLDKDRSLPESVELQEAMKGYVSGALEVGWEEGLVRIFKGFTHFNRLAMIVRLSEGEATQADLRHSAGVVVKSVYHHLRYLFNAGLIGYRREYHKPDVYFLMPQTHPIARVLLKQTLQGVSNGARYYNPRTEVLDADSKAVLKKIRKAENVTRGNVSARRGTGKKHHRLSKAAEKALER